MSSQREQTQAFYKATLEEQKQHEVETEHRLVGTLHAVRASDASSNKPTATGPDNLPWLDHFRRPREILSCYEATRQDNPDTTYRDCACQSLPNPDACQQGYADVSNKVPLGTIETDPNSVIAWCRDPHNIEPQIYNSDVDRHSWVLGCLMGVRGAYHYKPPTPK